MASQALSKAPFPVPNPKLMPDLNIAEPVRIELDK
jgi:hypothetical protein